MATDTPRAAGEKKGEESDTFLPRQIDPSETYRRINVKRQIDVAKAIIAEKKGVELLQKFEDEKAAYLARKQAVVEVRERRQREIRNHQLASAEQMNAITRRMQVEERTQVTAMIRDSASRKDEQHKAEAEKAGQRQHLAIARKMFEEQRLQQQKQKEADRVAAIAKKLEEKDEARIEGRKKREEEEKAAREEAIKNNPALKEKAKPVVPLNKRHSQDVALDNPMQARYDKAEKLRLQRLADVQRGLKEKFAVAQAIKEKKKARMEEWHLGVVEECQKHIANDSVRKFKEQKAAELREKFEAVDTHRAAAREKWANDKAKFIEDHVAKLEAKDSKPRYGSYQYTDDKDPHARYFKLTAELKSQKEHVLITHDFGNKVCKDAEEILKSAPYDSRLKRLDDLEEQLSKQSTTAGPSLMTARSGSTNFDLMTEQEKRKVFGVQSERCGLCEQDFTTDQLKGVTTVARIEKLRRGWTGEPDTGGSIGGASSYDSVRLCVICLQLVRQHTKNDATPKPDAKPDAKPKS